MSVRFSIVMPVYNVEKYIDNSVQSVLNQTVVDYELILVDDGSTDSSSIICDLYAQRNPQIKVIHQENLGISRARNTGERCAQGKYLYFLDSDDIMQPETLESFENVLHQHSDTNFIFTDFQRVNIGSEFEISRWDRGYEVIEDRTSLQEGFMMGYKHILAPGTLYNIDWYRKNNLSFDNNPFGEDQLFIYNELLYVDKVVYIKKPLYNYLTRPNSIMTGSSYERIAKSYPFMKQMSDLYHTSNSASSLVKEFLLSRWCLSVCHSCAKVSNFTDYKYFLDMVDADILIPKLTKYPSFSVRILSIVFSFSKRIFYLINRKI